ncbi:MAG: hypothetical protein HY070_02650 [Chloroflexi bacterium]|nr:hypothetical protein [Chloroflexota bacterium]
MPPLRFDTYYRYDDLTKILHAFAREFPNRARIESIGKSYQGRDIWRVTVTNFSSGDAREKPAVGRARAKRRTRKINREA